MKSENKKLWRVLYYGLLTLCFVGIFFQYSDKMKVLAKKKELKNSAFKKIV
jgi:hypothetical protein